MRAIFINHSSEFGYGIIIRQGYLAQVLGYQCHSLGYLTNCKFIGQANWEIVFAQPQVLSFSLGFQKIKCPVLSLQEIFFLGRPKWKSWHTVELFFSSFPYFTQLQIGLLSFIFYGMIIDLYLQPRLHKYRRLAQPKPNINFPHFDIFHNSKYSLYIVSYVIV